MLAMNTLKCVVHIQQVQSLLAPAANHIIVLSLTDISRPRFHGDDSRSSGLGGTGSTYKS